MTHLGCYCRSMERPCEQHQCPITPQNEAIHSLNEWFIAHDLLFLGQGAMFTVFSKGMNTSIRLLPTESAIAVSLSFELATVCCDTQLSRAMTKIARRSPSKRVVLRRTGGKILIYTSYHEYGAFSMPTFKETFCSLVEISSSLLRNSDNLCLDS